MTEPINRENDPQWAGMPLIDWEGMPDAANPA